MKKNYLKIALVSAFAIAAGYNVYNSQEEVKLSEMALENIEALARNENQTQTCTRAVAWANCYDRNGVWRGMRITAVESYQVSSVVEMCEHAQITSCPSGSM